MSGSAMCRDWNPWSTPLYQGWQVEKSRPHSSTMTLLQTIQRLSSQEDDTALTTHDCFMPDQTHTPAKCSPKRRCTPSIQMKPSHPWLTSHLTEKGTPCFQEKYNTSVKPMKEWQILPKIWPNLKNSIGIHSGKNTTSFICWPKPMHSNASNHISSTMCLSPPTSHMLCSMQVSMTSPTGGNMAPNMTMLSVSGVCSKNTPLKNALKSTSVSYATERGILNCIAASLTSIAEMDKSVECPTTTLVLPTHHAQPTSGPSDDRKDIDRGVMS